MENDNKTWEQPEENNETVQEELKDNIEESGTVAHENSGSQFGKFCSAESLLEAYNNLQREFTKKCQKLSEFEREKSDNALREPSKCEETKIEAPDFEREDWHERVADFLCKNEHARGFSKEISEEILKSPELRTNSNALELAWTKVLAKNFKTPEEIAGDENFMKEYILNNENVKKKILSSYIEDIKSRDIPPVIGSGIKGGQRMISKSSKPNSLQDAKNLVEKLFKI